MPYGSPSSSARKPRHDAVLNRLYKFSEAKNVAVLLTDAELGTLGNEVVDGFNIDEQSNEEWRRIAQRAMDIALQARTQKNYPFPGAANVKYPLITVAALQFNARAYPAVVDSDGIVKAKVIGEDEGIPEQGPDGQPAVDTQTNEPIWKVQPGAKAEKAERISEHMSYQLLEEMDDWEEDTDTLLIQLPIVGTAFRKVYRGEDQNCADLVPALDLVVNRKTKSLKRAPRITHKLKFYPFEIEERQRDGRWIEIDLAQPADAGGDKDAPHDFIEQHRRCDLDEDGYPEPYIITVHKDSQKIVRIVANYDAESVVTNETKVLRIVPKQYFVKYGFIRDPRGGFYDIGFGFLLESLGAAIDTTINQMLDAGHLQNAGGGFIASGVRTKKALLRMQPGVYHTVDASGDNLRNAIVNMEHPGPSAVLFQLLGLLIDAARDITATKDILTGDTNDKTQTATTTLALIEQGTKLFTAIYKRIYGSLKQEFKLLFDLNAEYLDDTTYFNLLDTPKAIAKSDYNKDDYDVCPVADPASVTDMQRLGKAQFLLQTFLNDPLINQQELRRRALLAAKIDDIDALLVDPPQPDPMQQAAMALELEGKQAENEKTQSETAKNLAGAKHESARVRMDAIGNLASLVTPQQQTGEAA